MSDTLIDLGQVDPSDGHWLAGLIDGEGCFFLSTLRRRSVRGYGKLYPRITFDFKLAMRADDLAVVERAQRILGCGYIHYRPRYSTASTPNGKPLAVLNVVNRSEVPHVIAFFRRFPLHSKKARDFSLWAEAFELFQVRLDATPLTGLSKGILDRPAKGKRRFKVGTPRRRWRNIPQDLLDILADYERRLKELREYKDPFGEGRGFTPRIGRQTLKSRIVEA